MLPASTAPPSQVAPPPEQSHIPLPCEAVSPPLPFGTGHETNITILRKIGGPPPGRVPEKGISHTKLGFMIP
ncbi:hypothetical protein JHK84_052192 [Glycine max]|uniref:Uncharacterized protein n=1 Tax=Glycine soja TaxID=3848 RepID=A0A0B2SV80_GLYSO|nr:hypothetical protein JHK85_053003 [Glycine max]KAG5082154.1 hypothetical protein JHK84_052192 [Glycine max]KHN48823.1 hypothetical protein glysoja_030593 [Glycine soja]